MGKLQLVTLKLFPNKMEAEMAKGLLDSAGIRSLISADVATAMFSNPFASTAGVELVVKEEDVERAKVVLDLKDV